MKIGNELQNPSSRYRTLPFWSWNDRLEKAELDRQMEEMHQAGVGGFFIHARDGLQTPYMGEEWMAAVKACVEKGKALGMEIWLYDENTWPSGSADGKVPAMGERYRQKRLAYEAAPFEEDSDPDRTIAYYARSEKGYRLLSAEERSDAELRLYYKVNPDYIDVLSEHVVAAFIEAAYEAYWEKLGPELASIVPGVFTDEPQYGRGTLPWSFDLPAEFMARHGYDVTETLPSLFLPTEDCRKHRYDYWETVTAMFARAYSEQIGAWCEKRGWKLTGHVVEEQTLMGQVSSVGDPLASYEFLHIPGCDWLGNFISEEPIVPKQVSSVARQLGRKQAITESFGCAGWNASFQDLKRIGEWQYVHGINLLCQHLQSYSLKGLRKRDYPPSLFYQQPWWGEYRVFNDYFARLSLLLSEGERQADVLLLHPVRSGWVEQQGRDASAIEPYHASFAALTRWLCQSFVGHDYGSEGIIERHGRVDGGKLIVGHAAYSVVVIPPSVTLAGTTVRLLRQFAEEGGSLIAFPGFPSMVNGVRDSALDDLIAGAVWPEWSREALLQAVADTAPPSVILTDGQQEAIAEDTINIQELTLDGAHLYYLVNSGNKSYENAQMEIRRSGILTLIDLETGGMIPARKFHKDGSGIRVRLDLHPAQSFMLMVSADPLGLASAATDREAADDEPTETEERTGHRVALGGRWTITAADLNCLTLDNCRLRIGEGEWSELQPVIFLQERLKGLDRATPIELEFEFDANFEPGSLRELYLVMEEPKSYEIRLNGCSIESRSCGWWRDISFRKLDIGANVQRGKNRLRLSARFNRTGEAAPELESVYLLGDFGVRSDTSFTEGERAVVFTEGPFQLTETPEFVESGDLVRQGFPFFAGKIRLAQTLKLESWARNPSRFEWGLPPDAVVGKLFVNGQEIRTFVWEPYETDLTSYLQEGENLIELELSGSCRNLLGPHHHIKGEPNKVGPDSFKDRPGWTDKDLSPDTPIYQARYAFVRFGLRAEPTIEIFD
ncbi:glycosyl hydrolase [Cohnella sp. AR92]|uniref:glycosyl hydrolase n=1 Tax=Cohnella sp. AR92 TaxID=648716 RepID=UPI0013159700|nr:glycosyl hydrolase [Cohnella sp. AR92]